MNSNDSCRFTRREWLQGSSMVVGGSLFAGLMPAELLNTL